METLPQHRLDAPFDGLLTLGGDPEDEVYDSLTAAIRQSGPVSAVVSKLVAVATDETFDKYAEADDRDRDPRIWARCNALSVIAEIGEEAASAIESILPLLYAEDLDLADLAPFVLADIGVASVPALEGALRSNEFPTEGRERTVEALAEIAEREPDVRAFVITAFEETLSTEEDEELNAILVGGLMDVGSAESMPIIKQAFDQGRVDAAIVDLIDVQEHFAFHAGDEDLLDDGAGIYDLPSGYDDDEIESDEEPQEPYVAPPKVGRNEPCPCGSGKKYKKCCGGAVA